jgi:molybdenum cofactor cytidylyltransferase
VLAAGASTRMGFPKQLIEYEREPLVRRAARAALECGAQPVVVVLGANAEMIAPALDSLEGRIRVVVNDNWKIGLSSSLRAGLRALSEDEACDGVLVTLADQPLVDANTLQQLLAAFDDEHRIVASAYSETVGVPALFGREHIPALMRLEGDSGAGTWLRNQSGVTQIRLDDVARSVETPADIAELLGDAGREHSGNQLR